MAKKPMAQRGRKQPSRYSKLSQVIHRDSFPFPSDVFLTTETGKRRDEELTGQCPAPHSDRIRRLPELRVCRKSRRFGKTKPTGFRRDSPRELARAAHCSRTEFLRPLAMLHKCFGNGIGESFAFSCQHKIPVRFPKQLKRDELINFLREIFQL